MLDITQILFLAGQITSNFQLGEIDAGMRIMVKMVIMVVMVIMVTMVIMTMIIILVQVAIVMVITVVQVVVLDMAVVVDMVAGFGIWDIAWHLALRAGSGYHNG